MVLYDALSYKKKPRGLSSSTKLILCKAHIGKTAEVSSILTELC